MSDISYVPSFYHLSSVHHYHLVCYIFDECLPNQNVNSMRTGISLSLPLSPSSCHPPSHLSYTPRKFCYKRVKKIYISIFYIFMCVSCTRNRWHTQMGYTEDIHRIFYSGWTFKKTSKGMVRHSDISNSGKQLLLIGLKRQREGMMWLEQCES